MGDVICEEFTDLSVVAHQTLPRSFSDHVTANVSFALVNKASFLVKCTVECSNDGFIGKLNHEFGFSIDFKANVHISFQDEDDL